MKNHKHIPILGSGKSGLFVFCNFETVDVHACGTTTYYDYH